MNRVATALLVIAALPAAAAADDDPAAASDAADATDPADTDAAEPAPAPPRWFERITLTGLVDGYLAVPLQGDARAPSSLRVFDGVNGSFTLAYAELAVELPPAPAGLRIDLGFGPVADLTSLEPDGDGAVGPSEVSKHVQQAYASLRLPTRRTIVVDAGRFVTPAGAEVIEAKDDWLYTRSLLFGYSVPFAHTGVRVTAAMTDALSVQAMVVNGWDVGADPNLAKTVGASLLYQQRPTGLTAAINTLVGKEAADVRTLVDLIVGVRDPDGLSWNLNLDIGKEGSASWYGTAAMVSYPLTSHLRLAARGERFEDLDGVRTGIAGGASLTELTGCVGVPVGANAEVRFEARLDHASAPVFAAGTAANQATLTAAALAWF